MTNFDKPTYPKLFLPNDISVRQLIKNEFGVNLPVNDLHGMREEMAIQIDLVPNERYLFIEAKYLHFYYKLRGMKWDVKRMNTIEFNNRVLHKLVIQALWDDGKNFYEEGGSLYFDVTEYFEKEDGKPIISYQLLAYDYHGDLQERGYEFLPSQLN